MKVHVINSMSGMIRVHKIGCKDIVKDTRRANSEWTQDVPDGETIGEAVVRELNESFGWQEGSTDPQPFHEYDIEILPCARKS